MMFSRWFLDTYVDNVPHTVVLRTRNDRQCLIKLKGRVVTGFRINVTYVDSVQFLAIGILVRREFGCLNDESGRAVNLRHLKVR